MISIADYRTISIFGFKISFPERIKQYEIFGDRVAVRVNANKADPEFGGDLNGSNVFIADANGIIWQYPPKKGWISNIWKKDENTLCMYDGTSDVWVDVNKLEVIRMIWNPWGLDEPEQYSQKK
jgi:hypothetical protein